MTLVFSVAQAEIAANASVKLISPFVGRIYDWYKAKAGASWDEEQNSGINDPGVKSVQKIFKRLKEMGSSTEIMGASFRNVGQIIALAGCDLLTISPALLTQLKSSESPVVKVLDASQIEKQVRSEPLSEDQWRFAMCEDEMASFKLDEGIRAFVADGIKLKELLKQINAQG